MPGTTHGAIDHEAVDERRMVMRAMSPYGEYFHPATHEENFFVVDMANQFAAVGKLR
jgi:hypothetical protein